MNIAYYTLSHLAFASWAGPTEQKIHPWRPIEKVCSRSLKSLLVKVSKTEFLSLKIAPVQPLRTWLNSIESQNPKTAKLVCKMIPAQCPFERVIRFHNRVLLKIPPLCKLNPVYEELVSLRFRALCYLADECGEDISPYLT
ncbi:MAG: Mo-dependent nitrogenase C-terminal domain-containing protein [Microcoleaceae cyanobacterium]